MPITILATSTGVGSTIPSSFSISGYIPTGTTAAFVGFSYEGLDRRPYGVTWGTGTINETFSSITGSDVYEATGTSYCQWFGKLNPTPGSGLPLAVSGSNSLTRAGLILIALSGGSTSGLAETVAINHGYSGGGSNFPTVNINTISTGSLILATTQTAANELYSSSQTSIFSGINVGDFHGAQYMAKSDSGIQNIQWTGTAPSQDWSLSAISYPLPFSAVSEPGDYTGNADITISTVTAAGTATFSGITPSASEWSPLAQMIFISN